MPSVLLRPHFLALEHDVARDEQQDRRGDKPDDLRPYDEHALQQRQRRARYRAALEQREPHRGEQRLLGRAYGRVEHDSDDLAVERAGRNPRERLLRAQLAQQLACRGDGTWREGNGDRRREQRPENREEQPQPERHQRRGRWRAEHDREQHREREPHAGIDDGHAEHDEGARHLLDARRQPEQNETESDGGKPAEKFAEQERVAIDRLRQDPAERTLVVLAVDEIEAEPDRDERHKERQERDERQRQLIARAGEEPQEQERILGGDLPDLRDRRIDRRDAGEHYQPFEHPHAHAGQVVRQLLEEYDAHAAPG